MTLLSWLIFVFWVIALGRTILNLLLVPRLEARSPARTPLVSVLVPARDEERAIERTVRALLAQTYPNLELIVVNDRSTDRTLEILEDLARKDSRLTVVTTTEPPPGWLGKPHALHVGSLCAHGDLLLFIDADVIYAPDAIEMAVAHFETRDVPMLTIFPKLEMHGFWEHVIMPNLAVFAFSFLPLWLTNRSRIPLIAVGGGPGNLITRGAYDAVGGHESLHDAVVDDVALARLVRRKGYRTEVVRGEGRVVVRMYHGGAEILRGFTKNAFAVFGRNYFVAAVFVFLAGIFHVLPFGLAIAGDVVSMGSVGLIVLTRLVLFRSVGYRLDNAILGHPLMMLAWLVIMLRSIWYTGIRRQLHWRGRTYDAGKTRFGAD